MNNNPHLTEDRVGKRARIERGEKAILVGLDFGKRYEENGRWDLNETMEELASLSTTAGLKVIDVITQFKNKPDPAYFIGEGKTKSIKESAHEQGAEVIVFNDELRPAQSRNLEEAIGRKIVDRAQLIMDIFAQRASTKEAKLQVELAQLEYLLPRLRGWGEALERLGGGIGTRGPGETRLENERQKIQRRIESIRGDLEKASQEWETRRKRRKKNSIPEIALVGYTNTGKTTLLNALTGAGGFTENKLFATLDPLTRSLGLPDKREVLLIDTVGLIRKLPHQLIPAFRSTLQSARAADLLINVMDITKEKLHARLETVNRILNEDVFGDGKKRPPIINVFNKTDLVEDRGKISTLKREIDNSITVSARGKENLDQLKEMIAFQLGDEMRTVSLSLPYAQADLLDWFHEHGTVSREDYKSEYIILEGEIERHLLNQLKRKLNSEGKLTVQK